MKRVTVGLVILSVLIIFNSEAMGAWWNKAKKQTPAPETANTQQQQPQVKKEAPKTPIDKEKQATLEKKKQLLASKLLALNNTQWEIDLLSANGKEKRTLTLTFKNNQVVSTFSSADFGNTNFTPTYNDDGTLIWETMQTSVKQGVLFWRGEMSPDTTTMRGIVSHLLPSKATKDYSFASTKKEALSPGE